MLRRLKLRRLLPRHRARIALVGQLAARHQVIEQCAHLFARAALRDQPLFQLGTRVFATRQQANGLRFQRDRQPSLGVLARRFGGRGAARRRASTGMPTASRIFASISCAIVRVLAQIFARVVLALADLVAAVRVPGAGLLDDVVRDAQLDDLALARDALAVQDVEQRLAERRRDLVLDHLDARLVADDFLAAA